MARQTIEQLTDDLDGSPADRSLRFGYGGQEYEIDLSDGHAADFTDALERYVAAARPTGRRRGSAGRRGSAIRATSTSTSSSTSRSAVDTASVRAWAAQQGIEVSARGRISGQVLQAYQEAQARRPSGDQAVPSTRRRRGAAPQQTPEAPRVGRRRRGDTPAGTPPRSSSRRRKTAGSDVAAATEPAAPDVESLAE